jgi:hypothetical protein
MHTNWCFGCAPKDNGGNDVNNNTGDNNTGDSGSEEKNDEEEKDDDDPGPREPRRTTGSYHNWLTHKQQIAS